MNKWMAMVGGLMMTGCVPTAVYVPDGGKQFKNSPPAHAKAHGRRAQEAYYYRYYPSAQVYFDVNRKVYFYLGSGGWKVSASLPSSLKVSLGSAVSMELDLDKPYLMHSEHKKKYPPGQMKHKKGKGKGNKWK